MNKYDIVLIKMKIFLFEMTLKYYFVFQLEDN